MADSNQSIYAVPKDVLRKEISNELIKIYDLFLQYSTNDSVFYIVARLVSKKFMPYEFKNSIIETNFTAIEKANKLFDYVIKNDIDTMNAFKIELKQFYPQLNEKLTFDSQEVKRTKSDDSYENVDKDYRLNTFISERLNDFEAKINECCLKLDLKVNEINNAYHNLDNLYQKNLTLINQNSAQKPILKVKENKNIFRKTFKRIFKDKKSIKNEHEYDNPYATVTEGNSKFFINLSEKIEKSGTSREHINYEENIYFEIPKNFA